MSLAGTIKDAMGWCPNAHTLHEFPVPLPLPVQVPDSDGGGKPALTFGWTNRYWIRVFAFALCLTGVGISLFAFADGNRVALLGLGLVIAILLYLAEAFRHWEVFRTVERDGIADGKDWYKSTYACIIPVIGAVLIIVFSLVVFLGLVPGLTMLMVNGFLAGFSAIAWYHLATILVWENRTGIVLFSDGGRIYRRDLP